jgi:hypothetical protein
VAVFFLGCLFLGLQTLAFHGYINVNHQKLKSDVDVRQTSRRGEERRGEERRERSLAHTCALFSSRLVLSPAACLLVLSCLLGSTVLSVC